PVVRREVGEATEGGEAGGIRAFEAGVDLSHHERPGARAVRSPQLLSVDDVVRGKEELRQATVQETETTAAAAAATSATSAAATSAASTTSAAISSSRARTTGGCKAQRRQQ